MISQRFIWHLAVVQSNNVGFDHIFILISLFLKQQTKGVATHHPLIT
jgi:hypothetical protein